MAVVGVVGASARAAVMSLARAGQSAWAVDLFADRDLARLAECRRCPINSFPDMLPWLADRFPPGPVLYAGGVENAPDVVRLLANRRPILGTQADVLERVRDPYQLAARLLVKTFAPPQLLPPGERCPPAGNWLLKKCRSSGGLGVRVAQTDEIPDPGSYLQEFIPGPPMSAVYSAFGLRSVMLGVTEQLIGEPWLHARQFHYAGNIGPVELDPELMSGLKCLGDQLASDFRVLGVFGVDFIHHEGRAWVLEANPRYPASVEVLELADDFAALATDFEVLASRARERPEHILGKAIYFAPHPITFPAAGPWDDDLTGPFDPWRLPGFADIPHPGDAIEEGSPVLTFFARGSSPAGVREQLQSRAAELDTLFGHPAAAEPSP